MVPTPHPIDRAIASPWFRPGATVLAAVSGGADSMAMLAALDALGRRRRGLRIVVAHLDHGLRPDGARDRELVESFADARGLSLVAAHADVGTLARDERLSLEAAGRRARYAFFRDAAVRSQSDWIATAHTRSDQVETVMMRILRGAGERGLAGIPARRGAIVRPLLGVTRADTLDYCLARGVPFAIDSTNQDRRYFRNHVRHDVLPSLRRVYPGIDAALLRTARNASDSLARIRLETEPRLAGALRRDGDVWVLDATVFEGLDESARAVLVGDALTQLGCYADIRREHYGALLAMAGGPVGSSVDLPGVSVRRDHDALVMRPCAARARPVTAAPAALDVPGAVTLHGWTVTARVEALAGRGHNRYGRGADETEFAAILPACIGPGPLVARPPRPGDRIRPFGMRGHKKLSDLFVDRKVPHRERARLIVVEAGGEIVWIPGVATSESARVGDGATSVLRLVATPAGQDAATA